MSDGLLRGHVEKLSNTNLEMMELEKLANELHAKSVEICVIRQLYEELQSSLHKKDLFLQQISSASEKLRAECNEKILNLEGENRNLALSLDEALVRIQDLEKKTCASSEEIAGLKRILLIKEEKNSEMQKNTTKDLKERDECILKLEEESRAREDQLKWKNEQFSHLEEAHKKLHVQFQESKVDWQNEKVSLVDEISSLQSSLDAQIRVSESLGAQLRICQQALAHEESRRKVFEKEVSEYGSKLENVFRERDEDIAELRILLRKKEMLSNEMEYKIQQLEQANSDLLVSLNDAQEAQFHNNVAPSLKKSKNKLQAQGQLHSECAINLKEREAEWNCQIEKLTGDINHCLSEVAVKNKIITELQKKLEGCQWLLEVNSEEVSTVVFVLKSEFYVASSKLHDAKDRLEMDILQIGEKNMFLNQQLLLKNNELHHVHAELKQRSDEVAVLKEKIKSLDSLKVKEIFLEEEVSRLKRMLEESNVCRSQMEQRLQDLENNYRENLRDALDMVNSELENKSSELDKCKLELQKSKSEVEKLKENEQAQKQDISNLLVTVNEKDARIGEFHEQISVLESGISAKSKAEEMLIQEKDKYIRLAEDRNCNIISLQREISQLKNDIAEKEAANNALLVAHNSLMQENERYVSIVNEKDCKIQELQKLLNQEFKAASVSLEEKDVMLDDALKTAECQKILEVEERNLIIANLEKELNSLREKVETQEKLLLQSSQVALQVEEMKNLELQELRSQLEKEKRCFEGLLEELESHKRALFEDRRKENIDRENLLKQLEGMYGQFGVIFKEDAELMGMLGELSHLSEEVSEPVNDGFNGTTFSPSRKSIQVSFDERTPLTELNF